MNQLVAIACSTPQAIPLAMEAATPFLESAPATEDFASGVAAFGPDGQPLVSRRPAGGRRDDELRRALAGGFVLHQLTKNLDGPFRGEDSPPYRYRRWVGALLDRIEPGTRPSDPVLAVPPHIARNIRGRRAAEEVFHLFVAFMHSFHNVDAATPDPAVTRRALHSALSLIPGRWGSTGGAAMVVCDGRLMVATSHDWPLWFAALGDMTDGRTTFDATTRLPMRSVPSRAVVLTDRPMEGPGWQRVPDGGFLLADRAGRWELAEA